MVKGVVSELALDDDDAALLPVPVPVLPMGPVGELPKPALPREAETLPSRLGSSAAPAAVRVARASTMRAAALAMLGLSRSAASISSTSSGSPGVRHQSASAGSEPLWGRVGGSAAFHCAGIGAVACAGGRVSEQPVASSSGRDNNNKAAYRGAESLVFLM